jgi:NADPH2:quinone reductase
MRAVMVERHGGPDVLGVAELDPPRPGPGQVQVEVAASGVNFIDIYERVGRYPKQPPFVAGSEGAGTVSAVGPDVTGVAVGDRVAWAMESGGGYAEVVVVRADRVVPIPESVPLETAAAVMLQGLTAHYLCETTFQVRAGQTALVHAASGGMGLLLTQMISGKGARVIGTTSSEEKAALAREAGAEHVIDYSTADVVTEVRGLTDGRGVEVVYDGVGRSTFDASLDCLTVRGTMVLFGAASGPVPPLDPQVLNSKGSLFLTRPSLGHYIATREELTWRAREVLGQVAEGRLAVRVGGRYSYDEAGRAHEDLAGRRTTGKLLVVP